MEPGQSGESPTTEPAQVQVWGDPDEVQKQPTAERLAYVHRMRRRFTHRCLLTPDLDINQEVFAPKACLGAKPRIWGGEEQDRLIKGIELHGVGMWREISDLLPDWNDNELRSRTAKLLGSQSLAPYIGWKGRKEHVVAEHKRNQRVGKGLKGCWRTGTLIEDDAGQLEAYYQKHPADQRPGPGLKGPAVPGVRDHLTPLSDPEAISRQADAAKKAVGAVDDSTAAAAASSNPVNHSEATEAAQRPLQDSNGKTNIAAVPGKPVGGKKVTVKTRTARNKQTS